MFMFALLWGYCAVDLQSIQTKLIQTVNTLGESDANVQVDWAGGPTLAEPTPPPAAGPRPGADYSAAVNTLQRRAERLGGNGDFPTPGAAVSSEVYLKRLSAMAQKINHLSAEQERAIAEMQMIQAYLAQVSPPTDEQGQPLPPPYLDYKRAVIASAEVDAWGNIVLAYRTVNPTVPNAGAAQPRRLAGDANQLASHLRTTYGPVAPRRRSIWSDLAADGLALVQEPLQLVTRLGHTVWGLGLDAVRGVMRQSSPQAAPPMFSQRPSTSGQLSRGASLSLVDSVLWFGGGVIGRLALNLLLAAFPALWSLAVAAITAVTAYALYRATLAPKLAFGPALRVALLVVGLIVGGQL